MFSLHKTRGGVHPPQCKDMRDFACTSITPPERVLIPLNMHIGAPASPVVSEGDHVYVGTLIGQVNGLGSPIHASISGTVTKVATEQLPTGATAPVVEIVSDGKMESDPALKPPTYSNKEEFIDMSDQRTAAIVRAYISNLRFTYGEYSEAMARLLEKNYKQAGRYVRKTKPQLLKVLYATNMPGVLTEIGFMSNPEELRYMCSEKGQNEIARSLFNAVKDYVNFVRGMQLVEECDDATTQAPVEPAPVVSEPAPQPAKAAAAKKPSSGYTIQILASTKRLKSNDWQFKSYKNKVIELRSAGRYRYKYCVGRYATQAEAKRALSQVKKSFGDAYIVRYEGDAIAR